MASILVVDDDRATRHLNRGILAAEAFTVATSENGPKALEKLRREHFDLALVDVWMPGMSGLELLGKIREELPELKVIVMTADDTPETLLQAIAEQAYQFVRKPVAPAALVELVRTALSSESTPWPIQVVSAKPEWVELLVPCDRQTAGRIQDFLAQLNVELPEGIRESIGSAFHELLMNAIEWGGRLDPTQRVRISYLRARRMILYRIADPGPGFRFQDLAHAAVGHDPDRPTEHLHVREEMGLRPGGFGLAMTRALVDELLYNEKCNEVVFVKYLE